MDLIALMNGFQCDGIALILSRPMRVAVRLACTGVGFGWMDGGSMVRAESLESAPEKIKKATSLDNNRADPEKWNSWRSAPIAFPDLIEPRVPEAQPGTIIDFGKNGQDLAVILPDQAASDYEGRGLDAMVAQLTAKVPQAAVLRGNEVSANFRQRHLLVLGTLENNSFAREMFGQGGRVSIETIPLAGYRLDWVKNPFSPNRKIISALAADATNARSVAAVIAFSIHPDKKDLTPLTPWPLTLPTGTYWAPFVATFAGGARSIDWPAIPVVAPTKPAVVFGVRIWGSPMPTLESFQRLVRALKPLGINTIAIQGGGWPDLPQAAKLYRDAVDLAWREGIFSVIYVGNEMEAHRPAALTANHEAIVLALKDHPGLLQWHLYNQLAGDLTPDESRLVQSQLKWLRSVSEKPIGVEVVWGHDSAKIPANKLTLIKDLKSWGMNVVASDDAPIGGWSKRHDLGIWEQRFLELRQFGLPMQAVLQAHVPFVQPTLPTAAQVRNQFWWAFAGGAHDFFFETAYLFTHISVRGILSWDLRLEPDGRFQEIKRLSSVARALQPVIVNTEPTGAEFLKDLGFGLNSSDLASLRVRRAANGDLYLIVINRSTDSSTNVSVALAGKSYRIREITPGNALQELKGASMSLELAPGDGACFQLVRIEGSASLIRSGE